MRDSFPMARHDDSGHGGAPDTDPAAIARVAHEAVRAYKQALGQDVLPPWDDAPEWMHEATLVAVKDRLTNPTAPPSAQHEAWLAQKQAAGWRYGKVKDAEAKTHPLMVPYAELPDAERRKDALIQTVVDALTLRSL